MLILAFSLSLLFVIVGMIGLTSSSDFSDMAWLVMIVWPGAFGFALALISLGVRFIPYVKEFSPSLTFGSCVVTISMVVISSGSYLLSLVWK